MVLGRALPISLGQFWQEIIGSHLTSKHVTAQYMYTLEKAMTAAVEV